MRAALPETSWSLRECQTSGRLGAVVSCAEVATSLPDVSGKVDEGLWQQTRFCYKHGLDHRVPGLCCHSSTITMQRSARSSLPFCNMRVIKLKGGNA